jgi:Restriction endonuclease NotI
MTITEPILPAHRFSFTKVFSLAESFHIAEWYGRPFLELSDAERLQFAGHKVGSAKMNKSDAVRLSELKQLAFERGLTPKETERLTRLGDLLQRQNEQEKPCPFKTDTAHPVCTKKGGVCSLRLYTDVQGQIATVHGPRGQIRALCPSRFHQQDVVFKHIGKNILSDDRPFQVGEVGFLESTGNLDSASGEDVGRIDMILVKSNAPPDHPMEWIAVEIQAVYFSGREMKIEFENLARNAGRATMPLEGRRPDYRSSGPKRLMPQLQIKVPTLRRWGKKMAVVVDEPFFSSMGEMQQARDVSNADIVWILVDFVPAERENVLELVVVKEIYTTLEHAIDGLTGGLPVTLDEFQRRIRNKVGS